VRAVRALEFWASGKVASPTGPTRLVDSTPAAMYVSPSPALIASAQMRIEFRLEAQ